MALSKDGFDDKRFETAVAQSLHCPICENVFKQPVMCRRNEHLFCRTCITEHLNNSRTCPLCRDELTVETLSKAPRVLTDTLSELKIRCDYFKRGCREVMQLGDLERHVKDCGFAAVVCSNEGCLAEINKRDRIHHEIEVCEFRKVQCHNCAETMGRLTEVGNEVGQNEIKKRLDELAILKGQMLGIQTAQKKMMKELQGIKTGVTKVKHNVVVAGGDCVNFVETFNLEKRTWTTLQPMKKCREEGSSFVYKNQLVVAGGWTDCGPTDDMEAMNIDPVAWFTPWRGFPVRLHSQSRGHKNVVYNNRLLTIGGYDGDRATDSIHEVQLVPPYASELLTRLPEPRVSHGAELFNDKFLLLEDVKHSNTETPWPVS